MSNKNNARYKKNTIAPSPKILKLFGELKEKQQTNLGLWNDEQDKKLKRLFKTYKEKNWERIASQFEDFTSQDCLIRHRKITNTKMKKGSWNNVEDQLLINAVHKLGLTPWYQISELVPGRNAKQCRERWKNQLDPTINREAFTEHEKQLLKKKVAEIGTRWCIISKFFKGRPENMLKNYWYSIVLQVTNKNRRKRKTTNQKKKEDSKKSTENKKPSKQKKTQAQTQTNTQPKTNTKTQTNPKQKTNNQTNKAPNNFRKRTYSNIINLDSEEQVSQKLSKNNNQLKNSFKPSTHLQKSNASNNNDLDYNNTFNELINFDFQMISESELFRSNPPKSISLLENEKSEEEQNTKPTQETANENKNENENEIKTKNENLFENYSDFNMSNGFVDMRLENFNNDSLSEYPLYTQQQQQQQQQQEQEQEQEQNNNDLPILDPISICDQTQIDLNNLAYSNDLWSDIEIYGSVSDFGLWDYSQRGAILSHTLQFF
ncbi:snRNA-activating protein complex subunit 4 [Anaeramoeba flamelloides]|uniref:snRNA-activating protein complex subunit 4 n=1 Tax=Anaeramoeba flamelloides TaxID=1746091 RepID=A0ABQ8YGL3_9EUKA|nr:snRNA-activating protein complex subunit 4 [Anaeramoeba flamelloides]